MSVALLSAVVYCTQKSFMGGAHSVAYGGIFGVRCL